MTKLTSSSTLTGRDRGPAAAGHQRGTPGGTKRERDSEPKQETLPLTGKSPEQDQVHMDNQTLSVAAAR